MSNRDIKTESERKRKWTNILFWMHVVIFGGAAIFFFLALTIIFGWLKGPDSADLELFALFKKFVWALWSLVIVQVAGGIFALSKGLFGLSSKGDVDNSANKVTEIIEGFVSNNIISKEHADLLREGLSNVPEGVAGTVLGK
jgi:hypothetical protein